MDRIDRPWRDALDRRWVRHAPEAAPAVTGAHDDPRIASGIVAS